MFKKLFKKKVKYGTYIDRCIKEYGAIITEYNPYFLNNPFNLGDGGPKIFYFLIRKDGLIYEVLDKLENIEIEVIKHFYKDEVRDNKINQILDAND